MSQETPGKNVSTLRDPTLVSTITYQLYCVRPEMAQTFDKDQEDAHVVWEEALQQEVSRLLDWDYVARSPRNVARWLQDKSYNILSYVHWQSKRRPHRASQIDTNRQIDARRQGLLAARTCDSLE